jgi:elongation factor 2
MGRREEMVKLAQQMMRNKENIRNIGIIAHIDHGKTTMTDSLIAAVGLMSEELAGKQLLMDFYELEQQRGITINAANISIVYKYEDQAYLVNIIDTPGHVDFGGEVIRAMRAVDGVVVVVDAVEGVMPQTETVLRQALRENCKPVLFVNKVDRLINELKVDEKEMQERLLKVIAKVNMLIRKFAPEQFKDKWQVNVEDGSVVFGSALYKWAISVPQMKKTNIGFKEVFTYCKEEKQDELSKKSPLYRAVMEMVVRHLPSPVEAQKYRIPNIWAGDLESEAGKAMINCDENGPLAMMITDVTVDPHAGEIATGRIFSGTLRKGVKVRIDGKRDASVQQVCLYMGPERVNLDEVPAGNIAAIVGMKDVRVGETISNTDMQPFESFKSSFEPVITVSIEAKKTADLPKLIEVLNKITKEDPNIVVTINQETGEHLLSGMGELHLEVTKYRIEVDNGIPIEMSDPIVVYRETVRSKSPVLTGKSPNKHNQFMLTVETMSEDMLDKLIEAKIEGKIRKKDADKIAKLEEIGLGKDDAKRVWWVHNNCILIDNTRGIEAIQEIKELVCQGFVDAVNEGPLAKEKALGIIVRLHDAKLHEDAIHRGPAQVLPAITRTIYACMLSAKPVLLEPRQKIFINIPQDYMGAVTKELQQRRATIEEIRTEGDTTIIIAIAPVKELIGFSSAIRSATQGRAIWTAEFYDYKALPEFMQKEVIKEVRVRKGLDPEPKSAEYFLS